VCGWAPPAPDTLQRMTLSDGLRFAFGTLTVFRVPVPRWDRDAARAGMLCAPLAGAAVGGCAAAAGGVLLLLGAGPLVAAVASVAVPAALTRGLHLDGLADTADGLGSGKPAEEALRVMKQSDIGPFGVLTLVFVLLGQVAAVATLYGAGWTRGALAVVVASVAGRAAMTLACRDGVPAARPDGLGAVVAGTLPARTAWRAAAAVVAGCAVLGALAGTGPYGGPYQGLWPDPYGFVRAGLAAGVALAAAELLLRRCRTRLGGVTGDVFGALCETAVTAALVGLLAG
jgi:adenosylcobinamide-GDP ribazoletransferase